MPEHITQIIEFIARDELEEAINLFKKEGHDKNALIQIKRSLYALKNNAIKGILTKEEIKVERSYIADRMLGMLGNLSEIPKKEESLELLDKKEQKELERKIKEAKNPLVKHELKKRLQNLIKKD